MSGGARAALIAAVLVAAPAAAHAFPTGFQFDMDALDEDGAGGVAFTGAPRFAGHTCDVCHTDGPRKVSLRLEADPVDVFSAGYAPGTTYHLRVVLQNTWAGAGLAAAGDNCGADTNPYHACDDNGFSMEIDDAHGHPVGTLAATNAGGTCGGTAALDADVYVLADHTAVTQNGIHHAQTAWNLCWTAPAQGTGPVTAYLSGVDGNGGDGTAAFPNDPTGDDVAAGAVPLIERGGSPPPAESGGCDASGGAASTAALVAVALAALGLRRRRRAALAVAVAVAAGAGCAHVKPQQREYLADKKMVFGADATEDELDLHMQEAREGSAGGYGSAGGGCGCN